MHLKQEFWKVWRVDCCVLVAGGCVVPGSCGGDLWSASLSLVPWGGARAASLWSSHVLLA